MSIVDCFPLNQPRSTQVEVLKAIELAFSKGYKNVLLDAPVGSGKSAIAVAAAKFYGDAHILTPRKALQDQYVGDFNREDLVSMKGRNSYPCHYSIEDNLHEYEATVSKIRESKVLFISPNTITCAEGPCLNSPDAKRKCVQPQCKGEPDLFTCPYHVAVEVAQKSDMVVHNLHSFIFQTYYAERFVQRSLLVVDECHEMEGILRGFAEKKVTIPLYIKDEDAPVLEEYTTLEHWVEYLNGFVEAFSTRAKSNELSPREEYETILRDLLDLSDVIGTKFVVSIDRDRMAKRSKFMFIPEYVGNLADRYILNYGEKRLLMSGTIYSKSLYCRLNGLREEETCYIKIGSSFPKNLRPIYAKPDYMVDTSHKMWDANFKEIITKIKKIMEVFHDKKGLIHAPSYHASLTLYNALKDTKRMVTHDKDNFQTQLAGFYASTSPSVFLSPTCQQGVDFKDDRARFQIILRVPYPSTSDPLMAKKVKEDFAYYNYQSLITFGQQCGRVNRSESDFGVTVLMDARFTRFLESNKKILPKWLTDAIVYK